MSFSKDRTLEIDNPEGNTTLRVMRRSTTDPVIFSRRESSADEVLPSFLNDIDVDDKGIGVELDSQNRVSVTHRSSVGDLQEVSASLTAPSASMRKHAHQRRCRFFQCCPCCPARSFVLDPVEENRICLVLDLDETLVHSSFTPMVPNVALYPHPKDHYDFVIPIKLGDIITDIYVLKRPGLNEFFKTVSLFFEVVIFTASLPNYANPLLDLLDPKKDFISFRLYREHCVFTRGNFVKDLRILGRNLKRTLIVDNSPFCYMLQPENAIACTTFTDDIQDSELPRLSRFLLGIYNSDDVTRLVHRWETFI